MYGFAALLASGPILAMGILAIYVLVSGLLGVVHERKRTRVIPTTYAYVAGGRAGTLNIAGPFNELHWAIVGTTDAHTLDGAGVGIVRSIEEITITSTKRGLIANMSGVTLYALSSAWFNTAAAVDTVGGAAVDGFRAILPLGVDMDESINISVRWGTLAEIASTGDLAGYTGVLTFTVELLDQNPEVYWYYRDQEIVVRGVGAIAQQPTPPVIPGAVLCKEVYATQSVALTTALSLLLANIRLMQSDDEIVNAAAQTIYDLQCSNKGFATRNGYILSEHRPVSNNDTTILTLTNGGVAIFATGMARMCYVYQSGVVTKDGKVIVAPTANNPQAASGAPPSPSRTQVGGTRVPRKSLRRRLFGRRV